MEPNTQTGTQEKNVQDDLKDAAHRIWLAGLGALAAAEEEGQKLFGRLVDRGRDVESKGKVEVDNFKADFEKVKAKAETAAENLGDKLGGKFEETLTSTLHRLGVPTRDEIRSLTQRVEELNAKIEHLKPRVTPAASPEIVTPETAVTPTGPSKIIV